MTFRAALATWPCWLGALASTGPAAADETAAVLPSVTIRGAAPQTASEGTVQAAQLANRPLLRPAEVLEAIPGMIVTQHSGDGKANQYFLRGFNLDHGSDFATQVLGMPVNIASHAHGQGYMDLNFLMPELIRRIDYRKGPYDASDGDFAVTGSARIDLVRALERPFLLAEAGEHRQRRMLAAGSRPLAGATLLAAAQAAGNDGPWDQPEGLRKASGLLRWSDGDADDGLALSWMGYQAHWRATEHVPLRAVERGEIGRFGALLPDDGGVTQRQSLSLEWARPAERGGWQAGAWWIDYALQLYSAPSGFISGPQGDQHEQEDRRRVRGGALSRTLKGPGWGGREAEYEVGLQVRDDRASRLGLHDTVLRQRTQAVRVDRLAQQQQAVYARWRQDGPGGWRSSVALRLDRVAAEVTPLDGAFNTGNGGVAAARRASPKLGLALPLGQATEAFANAGAGFHSNDARGATTRVNPRDGSAVDPVPLLVPARGAELGVRLAPTPGWRSTLTLWTLRLGSELVFIGDEGVTEPRGASRRHGVEWSNRVLPAPGWWLEADVAWAQARFVAPDPDSGGRQVPNAIPLTASLSLVHDDGGPWTGGLRVRHLGRYPLEPTGTQRSAPSTVLNLDLGWRVDTGVRLELQLLNLLDSHANDIEYWGGACTRGDGPDCSAAGGIDGRLVHPLEPRALRVQARLTF